MLKQISPDITLWKRVARLLAESSGKISIFAAILTFFEAALGIGLLYAIKLLIDALPKTTGVPREETQVFSMLALVTITLISTVLIQTVLNMVRVRQSMRVSEFVNQQIHDRAISVDYGFYESPRYFDSLQRARQSGTQRPTQIITSLFQFLRSSVFLAALFAMLAAIDWRILPAIAIAIMAVLSVRLFFTKKLFDWQRVRTQLERRATYLDWLITSDIHAKELRIGGLGNTLRDSYYRIRREINDQHIKIDTRRNWSEFIVSSIGALIFAGGTVFLVFETMNGRQTVGDLVFFVLLFRRVEASGREMTSSLSGLYDSQLYLRQLFEFLDVEPTITAPPRPMNLPSSPFSGLVFENVSFKYPGTDKLILKDINLSISTGQIVALVGENGSGKTTIIKLMTRLYDPTEGRIFLDGIDIRNFDPYEYRRLFSVLFQDYARYAATVTENIQYGDAVRPLDEKKIVEAAAKSGADKFILGLEQKYDSRLSRMFDDGVEISSGQWQRLALARSFYPNSSFIVMDEPSSALDPAAEFDLFENFRDRIAGRGALVISHRLSTVTLADYTYVLSNGVIVEGGNHTSLIDKNGQYARLFDLQAKRYRDR